MSSKVDASGSSSMGDVFQMFSAGDARWGKRFENKADKTTGKLRIGGLPHSISPEMVREFFGRFYSTVTDVRRMGSSVEVVFRFAGERDKALSELQGRELRGHRLSLSKMSDAAHEAPAVSYTARHLTDEHIFDFLIRREDARAKRDFRAADALTAELRACGVLVDMRERTWRCVDGRTGQLPPQTYGGQTLSAAELATQHSQLMAQALTHTRPFFPYMSHPMFPIYQRNLLFAGGEDTRRAAR
jgi:hypothetical protein|tara:strand:+ start:635 stop:1366 length:732 start_codon:yes stop_codon:yes gene_type:complete